MYCYGSGVGYGRFIDRVEQPLFVPGQKTNKSGNRKATSCRHVRCVETGEVFEKVRALSLKMVRKSNRGA